MARIKFGPIVVGIRGTLAGSTFSQNGAGAYVRAWARGANPRTPAQQQIRSNLTAGATAWRALTDLQRQAWNTFAADPAQAQTDPFGEFYYLSGFQWYVRINSLLALVERSPRSDPPTLPVPDAPTISTWAPAAGVLTSSTLTYPAGTFGAGQDLILAVALAGGAGVTAAPTTRPIILALQSPPSSSVDCQDELEAAFGVLRAGQQAFAFVARQTSDGRRSPWTTAAAILTE